MGNFDNYYIDENGKAHRDIPLGTSPADAYVRTNLKLKKEVQRIDGAMQEVSEHIDTEIARVDEAVVNAVDGTSRQIENAVNDINESIEEISDSIDTRIASLTETVNRRVDSIISHNNDTEGNTELIDIRTGADGTVYLSAGEAVRNQFAQCKSGLDELRTETYLSTSTAVTSDETYDGYIIKYNGTMEQSQYTTSFVVNKFENVPTGKYKAHGYPQNNNCLYVVVGSDQTVIEYQKVGDTLSGSGATDYDFYLTNNGCTVYVGGTHTTSPALYKYDKAVSFKDDVAVPQIAAAQNSLNPLYGKTVTLNGDSIAYGAGCTINGSAWGFMDFIADRNNMTLDKQAVSGGCLSFKSTEASGRHYICRTIENMDENADYVIFEGGYNDWWLSHSVGSITATMTDEIDDSTVYGALESICRQALEKWKTAKIGFVITHKINDAWRTGHSSAGVTLDGYYQAIRDVCEKYSIPYIDLSRVSRLNTEFESYKTFTSSSGGIHPNRTGYETFYVPAIENWIKNL